MSKKLCVRAAAFLLVLAAGFGVSAHVLGCWDPYWSPTIFETFYDLPKNSADAVWIGGSSVENFIIPSLIYQDTGVAIYPLTTSAQPFSGVPFLLEEAKKYQDPDLYLVDIRRFAITFTDDGAIRRVMDNMRPSVNWGEAVRYMTTEMWRFYPELKTDMISHYIPFMLYHARWNDLYKEDFVRSDESYFGYLMTTECKAFDKAEIMRRHQTAPIAPTDENIAYLEDVLDFCDTFEGHVVFTDTPNCMDEDQIARINYAKQAVLARGYELWDMNKDVDKIGLDYSIDFNDRSHTNVWGAQKVTHYVAQQLAQRYALPDRRGDPTYQPWADMQTHFEEDLTETELTLATDWNEYLDRLSRFVSDKYTVFITVRGTQGRYLDRAAVDKLKCLGFDQADILLDGQNHAFIGILSGGGVHCQQISAGEAALQLEYTLNDQQIALTSRTLGAGNSAGIQLGAREYGKNRNGFNIVVEDNEDGELVDSVAFDLGVETPAAVR